jgi:phage terminase large subunit-like protein
MLATADDVTYGARLDWLNSARAEQLEPRGDWTTWLYLAGRGAGKTRSCAEWLAWRAISQPGTRCAIVARTYGDARDTCAEGESGVLVVLNRYGVLDNYNRSIGEITLKNNSRIKLFSAEEPDRLRGPQHEYVWCDELAAWQYADTWDQLQFGLRLGQHPQVAIATTPRATKLLRTIMADPHTTITRGSTFDNLSNLAPTVATAILAKYEGTRLGRQEIYGEVLDDVEGALWHAALIDGLRVDESRLTNLPESIRQQRRNITQPSTSTSDTRSPSERSTATVDLVRIIVAVDPAVTTGEDSDETGIIAVGKGSDGHAYVLADRTCKESPAGWAHRAVGLFHELGSIGTIVGEANQGGDLIESTLRAVDRGIAYKKINAKQGKRLRAEPIAALYEQGRVHHVGSFPDLEDQMTGWLPDSGYSPDRLDALVHAIAELDLANGSSADRFLAGLAPPCLACGLPVAYDAEECPNGHKRSAA